MEKKETMQAVTIHPSKSLIKTQSQTQSITSLNKNKVEPDEEYDLLCSKFDPNKSSPPDEWSQRLLKRLGDRSYINNSLRRSSIYGNRY